MAREANNVLLFEANDWMLDVLKHNTNSDPTVVDAVVQNFSWAGGFGSEWHTPHNSNVRTLAKFDFQIERDDYTAVVGVGNNTDPLPYLLSYSYNAVVVGVSSGDHSTGLTADPASNGYGPGRSKPDLVVGGDGTTVSAATATVSSAATILREAVAGTDADRSEPMKAILMAGATKNEFAAWTRLPGVPLDDTFGAGELNVLNSYKIQLGGQRDGNTDSAAAPDAGTHGWDYGDITASDDLYYDFIVDSGSKASELSVILAWNAQIPSFSSSDPLLANLDLEFRDSSGPLIDFSVSSVDSVEHIYIEDLTPDTYTLKISADSASDFGLAWRMETAFDALDADFDDNSVVNGRDFLIWQQHNGTLINATNADGDADGDGDVDNDDLAVWNSVVGLSLPTAAAVSGLPEPTSCLLATLGAGALLLRRRRFQTP